MRFKALGSDAILRRDFRVRPRAPDVRVEYCVE
jgi:hypothetical protein